MIKPALLLATLLTLAACGKKEEPKTANANASGAASAVTVSASAQMLEVGCASCVYDMPGVNSCALAAKVDGKPMLVSGVPTPGHDSGICKHTCTAEITGKVEGDKFVASSFKLNP